MKATIIFLLAITIASCKKEKTILYGVDDVTLAQENGVKDNIKNTTEFISIGYADLTGSNISQSDLVILNTLYNAFGDKKMIEERIILNLIDYSGVNIPVIPSVSGDTLAFIVNTYKKLYNRDPNAFEQYYFKESIRINSLSPKLIYYALMTADEYRFY